MFEIDMQTALVLPFRTVCLSAVMAMLVCPSNYGGVVNRFLISYPVVVALGGIVILLAQFDYSGQEAPAWVQAVGSIAAILVAIAAVILQHSLEGKRRQKAERDEAYRLISLAVEFARDAWQAVAAIAEFRSNPLNTEAGQHRRTQKMRLQEVNDAIMIVPAERLATVEAARQVVIVRNHLDRAMNQIEGGPVSGDVHMGCGELYGKKMTSIADTLRDAHELLREEAYALM